jgi:hypothetical protein
MKRGATTRYAATLERLAAEAQSNREWLHTVRLLTFVMAVAVLLLAATLLYDFYLEDTPWQSHTYSISPTHPAS